MQLPGRAGQGAWVWNEQPELETGNAPSSWPSLLAWLWWSQAAPNVWPVHILGAEVLTSISPQDALGLLGGAAHAGAVPGESSTSPILPAHRASDAVAADGPLPAALSTV